VTHPTPTPRPDGRDRGSVLPFVLVMIVIGSMVVVPLLNYSLTVFRANHAVSELAAEAEVARAGLRMALAEPVDLYNDCGNAGLNTGVALSLPELSIDATTTCYLLTVNKARDDFSLPYSQVMTYVGATNVEGPTTQVYGTEYDHSGDADPTLWLATSSKDGAKDTVWLPDLPVHAITARSSTSYEMPEGYPLNGHTTCDIYFPGTYKQPLTLDGPTYFASGIYYFESAVTVVGGAKVLAGQGTLDGCSDDQYSAFYAIDAPSTHNISGLGATFVFGKTGRLVFDDTAGPIEFKMNQRYVGANDSNTKSSAMVSIMSVNGALDPALVSSDFAGSGIDLEVPGQLVVPLSYVDGADGSRAAPVDQYWPTTLTPAPREPEAPTGATAAARNGAVLVSWTAPTQDGGSPITGYTVKYRPASSTSPYTTIGCETTQMLSCVVPSLTNGTAYTFVVEAVNAIGRSAQSTASSSTTPSSGSPTIGNPGSATGISVTEGTPAVAKVSRYVDTLEVSWTAPASTGNGAILRYRVSVTDGSDAWECQTQGATTCVVPVPIPTVDIPTTPLQIAVYSYTRKSDGSEGSSSATSSGFYLNALGETYTAPPAPTPTAYAPPPIIDVNLTTANKVEISIPGYIAVPQSVVRVAATNPVDKSVALAGGVLSAWADVDADVADRPAGFEFGLVNPATQRVVRLVTTVDGSRYRGEAIVQVNETGAWAVNNWFVQ
jgi:hypothetical protein